MTALLAALLALSAHGQEAVVSGRVKAEPRVRPAASRPRAYASRAARYAKPFDYERPRGVVVYAEPAEDLAPEPSSAALRVVAGRSGPRISPQFLAVPAGAPLAARNESGAAVTLFAGAGSAGELSVALEPGASGSVTPSQLGLYRLFLLEAPGAGARLFAAGPRFCVADASGTYRLSLPAGRRRLTAWHERLPAKTEELALEPGAAETLDFTLSVQQLPEVP